MVQNLCHACCLLYNNLLEVSTRRSRLLSCPCSCQDKLSILTTTGQIVPPPPQGISATRLNNDKVFTCGLCRYNASLNNAAPTVQAVCLLRLQHVIISISFYPDLFTFIKKDSLKVSNIRLSTLIFYSVYEFSENYVGKSRQDKNHPSF